MSKIFVRLLAGTILSVGVSSADSLLFSMPVNLTAAPGDTVTVPVSLLNLSDLNGNSGLNRADLVLTYDPSVFTVSDSDITEGPLLVNLPANGAWNFVVNTGTLGEIDISFSSPSLSQDITATSGDVFADINFHVLADAPNGNSPISIVIPTALSLNGLTSDAMPDSGPNSIQGDSSGYRLNAIDQVNGMADVSTPEPDLGWATIALAACCILLRHPLRRIAKSV